MIYRIDVGIVAPVEETELADRVETAVTNLFPNATLTREPGRISELLHRQEILDAARNAMSARRSGPYFSFSLKKAAAFEGVVNFSVGEPAELGEIDVEVRVDEPTVEAFVDHVAPPTEDGPTDHRLITLSARADRRARSPRASRPRAARTRGGTRWRRRAARRLLARPLRHPSGAS